MNYHTPVLLNETITGLNIKPGGRYIDATVGGGGHTKAMLDAGATVLGIDTDADAVNESNILENEHCRIVQGNFSEIDTIAETYGFKNIDGIVFDLGVSSHQLDTPNRGFSYRYNDAPLDMRLDQTKGITAYEVINHESEETLRIIFETFGEEKRSGGIARAIILSRKVKPIKTTGDVLALIEKQTKGQDVHGVASRIFQAIRIYVNEELKSLKNGLEKGVTLLKPGGRIAVISFHSLEDRIVKQFMQREGLLSITKKAIIAGHDEQMRNSRSRSAKLRIAQKL